jgi:hypothetical protein
MDGWMDAWMDGWMGGWMYMTRGQTTQKKIKKTKGSNGQFPY